MTGTYISSVVEAEVAAAVVEGGVELLQSEDWTRIKDAPAKAWALST